MKHKHITKKLVFKKDTVVNLDGRAMQAVNGGGGGVDTPTSFPPPYACSAPDFC